MRIGQLYLQCVDDIENRIITVPASFTDYDPLAVLNEYTPSTGTHFTVKALAEADGILTAVLNMSTD